MLSGRLLAKWLAPVASAEPILVAVIAPVLLFPGALTPVAVLVVPALWLARLCARGQLTARTPFDGAIAAILLMTTLSLLPSFDLRYSLPKACGILLGVSVFYALANARPVDVWQPRLALALVLAGLAVALLGLLGTGWTASKVVEFGELLRALPTLAERLPRSALPQPLAGIHPNEIGGTLAMLLPPVTSLSLTGGAAWRVGPRIGAAVAALSVAAVLVLTQSRSAWFGELVVLGVYLLLRWGTAARVGLLLASLVGAVAVLLGPRSLLDLVDGATGGTGTGFTRFQLWRATLDVVSDHPIVGIGLNTFPFVLHTLYGAPDVLNAHAHNIYLQAAVDVGVPGAVSMVMLLMAAAQLAWPGVRRPVPVPGLAPGVGLGLLAFCSFGLTDAITLGAKPGVFFWAMLGALAIEDAHCPPAMPPLQRVVSGVAPVGAAIALLLATVLVAPEHARGWVASGRPDRGDWGAVAMYLARTTRPSDLILVEALPSENGWLLGAAYKGPADLEFLPGNRGAFLESLKGRERVWLVETLAAASDPESYAPRWSLPPLSRLLENRRLADARIGIYGYELSSNASVVRTTADPGPR
jgi:putative inorganic carbon (HCO3(-)) transporter